MFVSMRVCRRAYVKVWKSVTLNEPYYTMNRERDRCWYHICDNIWWSCTGSMDSKERERERKRERKRKIKRNKSICLWSNGSQKRCVSEKGETIFEFFFGYTQFCCSSFLIIFNSWVAIDGVNEPNWLIFVFQCRGDVAKSGYLNLFIAPTRQVVTTSKNIAATLSEVNVAIITNKITYIFNYAVTLNVNWSHNLQSTRQNFGKKTHKVNSEI